MESAAQAAVSKGDLSQKTVSPIPEMPAYYRGSDEKSRFILDTFNDTAADYDWMERVLGFARGSVYRREALLRAGLKPGFKVLDVAAGTGLVTREIAAVVGDPTLVFGVDPSPGMLANAKVPAGVILLDGRAESLPFPDNTFDFLSMGYALRHLTDLHAVFRELYRVLKPGGALCLLEITPPDNRLAKAVLKLHMREIVPRLGRIFAKSRNTAMLWRYYWDTIEACLPAPEILAVLQAAGFADARRVVSHRIFSEYQGSKPAQGVVR